jgi:hypothetical protein
MKTGFLTVVRYLWSFQGLHRIFRIIRPICLKFNSEKFRLIPLDNHEFRENR